MAEGWTPVELRRRAGAAEDATADTSREPVTVGLVSLGCPKNLVDGEVMLGHLRRRGHELVADARQADVIVVNTCAFIDRAKQESVDAVLEMARQIVLAPHLGGERLGLVGLAVGEMHRGQHGKAGRATRLAALEIAGDHRRIAAFGEERFLHAPAQDVLARPPGVLVQEGRGLLRRA